MEAGKRRLALATHRWTQAMGLQLLLIGIRAILADAIGVEKTTPAVGCVGAPPYPVP